MSDKISKIASRKLRDFRNLKPGICFGEEGFSLTVNDAYAVQEAVVNMRVGEDGKVIGHKVGCTDGTALGLHCVQSG
tara:strand:- start:114 stop:344 length:231 start_codon:yes stop_codon:yes gene_type:complete